ncbi:hypothetical protein MKX03_012626 [Papaver bracteatum]|nr:hypothetical protein MKX03_012626 [Papaver bracteatum]
MKVIAAYLLAVLGGNREPTAEDIKDILGSVGGADDADERIELILSQVKDKDLAELIACGREKLAQKKEEKVEEKIDEETDDDMPFDIFGFGSDSE